MELALTFNEAGCLLYQSGRGEQAYELFSGAMQALYYSRGSRHEDMDPLGRQLLLVDPSIQRAFDRMTLSGVVIPSTHWCSSDDAAGNAPTIFQQRSEERKRGNGRPRLRSLDIPFIFNEVFSMKMLTEIPCGVLSHYEIAISIVLYNEALILHRGQVTNTRRSLERALTFYGMAGRSLLEKSPRGFLQRHHLTSALCCGILNNMGFILHQVGDFASSQLCFTRLSEFLDTLPPPASEKEEDQRGEFELNIILFYQSLSTAAAA